MNIQAFRATHRPSRHLVSFFSALMLFAVFAAVPAVEAGKNKDIVEIAIDSGSFTTLVAAVQAAGLVDTLKGEGPFTLFAPNDEAFSKLPKEKLDALLADKEALKKVLTYHVVPGEVMAKQAKYLKKATTVQGQAISIRGYDGLMVDDAKVIGTDIQASNGVIHVIDKVILPQ